MGIKQDLGIKIKRMRKKRGMTQEHLAEVLNISLRTLSGIEIGENFVTADTLDKIVVALDTTNEDLFATEHLKTPQELVDEIISDIKSVKKEPEKLENIYKVVKSLMKE